MDDYGFPCPTCGCEMDFETCWQCGGEGGFHDCGEDCCPCLDPDLNETCEECNGRGRYPICPYAGKHASPAPPGAGL